jgi:hypothetical protein
MAHSRRNSYEAQSSDLRTLTLGGGSGVGNQMSITGSRPRSFMTCARSN